MTAVLEEVLGVEADDARLVGLRDVREDDVDGGDEHAVFLGGAGVLDDGCTQTLVFRQTLQVNELTNDVGALLGHANQVTP